MGAAGVEPTSKALEAPILPLYDAPLKELWIKDILKLSLLQHSSSEQCLKV